MKNKKALLTICIPTFNRGKRAYELVYNMLPKLDNTSIILVLDNASDNEMDYYKKIKKLSKKYNHKLVYIRHDYNRQFHGNYLACLQFSQSKYSMIISDEDTPFLPTIPKILKEFKDNKSLGLIRASIGISNNQNQGNARIYKAIKYVAGKEALIAHGFTNNYHSGTVYNNKIIKKYKLLDRLSLNLDQQYIYPHLYLELLIAAKADIQYLSEISVYEGLPIVIKDCNGIIQNDSSIYKIPYSYGSRVDQFIALRDAIVEVVDFIDEDNNLFVHSYLKLIDKFFYIIFKCDTFIYINNKMNLEFIRLSLYNVACGAILEYPTLQPHKEQILPLIKKIADNYKDN